MVTCGNRATALWGRTFIIVTTFFVNVGGIMQEGGLRVCQVTDVNEKKVCTPVVRIILRKFEGLSSA